MRRVQSSLEEVLLLGRNFSHSILLMIMKLNPSKSKTLNLIIQANMHTKICNIKRHGCGMELPINQFHFTNKSKGYRRPICKKCSSARKVFLSKDKIKESRHDAEDRNFINHNDKIIYLKQVYRNMKRRCYEVSNISYCNYGAKGVTVCNEWLKDRNAFLDWAVNKIPDKRYRIDKDTNGGLEYSPTNCIFIIHSENTKISLSKKVIVENVEFPSIIKAAKFIGMSPSYIGEILNNKMPNTLGLNIRFK